MVSKREPGIPVSFMDRFKEGEWWQKGNELLNLQNINACPSYYKGTVKAWVEELTTFIYLLPKDWEGIYEEYFHVATGGNGNRELKFYRNEEGYLRLKGIGEIYLKIAGTGEPLDYKILNHIGQGLSEQAEELFYSYVEYAGMDAEGKKRWIESIEKNIRKDMADKDLSDEGNMEFIQEQVFPNLSDDAKVVIAWGNTQQGSPVVMKSKQRILELWEKEQPSGTLYQLTADGLPKDNLGVHPLWG